MGNLLHTLIILQICLPSTVNTTPLTSMPQSRIETKPKPRPSQWDYSSAPPPREDDGPRDSRQRRTRGYEDMGRRDRSWSRSPSPPVVISRRVPRLQESCGAYQADNARVLRNRVERRDSGSDEYDELDRWMAQEGHRRRYERVRHEAQDGNFQRQEEQDDSGRRREEEVRRREYERRRVEAERDNIRRRYDYERDRSKTQEDIRRELERARFMAQREFDEPVFYSFGELSRKGNGASQLGGEGTSDNESAVASGDEKDTSAPQGVQQEGLVPGDKSQPPAPAPSAYHVLESRYTGDGDKQGRHSAELTALLSERAVVAQSMFRWM